MKAATQGLVAAALAAAIIRICWTGEYLHFVQAWMKWPLLTTAVVLLLAAVRPALGYGRQDDQVPLSAWMMLIPTVIICAVAPPPLGAFVAEHRPAQDPTTLPAPKVTKLDPSAGPTTIDVDEFTWGAAQPKDPMGLANAQVRMEGFVSTDHRGRWYVSRLVIFCCAADAIVERAVVLDQPAPARNTWVRVTGRWVKGTGTSPSNPAELDASGVEHVPTPKDPYS